MHMIPRMAKLLYLCTNHGISDNFSETSSCLKSLLCVCKFQDVVQFNGKNISVCFIEPVMRTFFLLK